MYRKNDRLSTKHIYYFFCCWNAYKTMKNEMYSDCTVQQSKIIFLSSPFFIYIDIKMIIQKNLIIHIYTSKRDYVWNKEKNNK